MESGSKIKPCERSLIEYFIKSNLESKLRTYKIFWQNFPLFWFFKTSCRNIFICVGSDPFILKGSVSDLFFWRVGSEAAAEAYIWGLIMTYNKPKLYGLLSLCIIASTINLNIFMNFVQCFYNLQRFETNNICSVI